MTPILQRLVLKTYRGIAGLELNDLSPVSLVVGANNAGKSSILEAAGLALRPSDPMQWISAVRHRDVDLALVDGLWSMFPSSHALLAESGTEGSAWISIEATLANRSRVLDARCTVEPIWTASSAEPEVIKTGFESPLTPKKDVPELTAKLEITIDGQPAVVVKLPGTAPPLDTSLHRVLSVTPGTHYSTKSMVAHLSRAVEEGKKQLAVDILRVFDPDVEDLDVVLLPNREAVRVTHVKRGVVDLSSFGDGMRRSAALALALVRASQGVLLIDEIEAGIHYSVLDPVLGKLLEAAASAQVQLVASTHSLEAVDALVSAIGARDGADSLAAYWVQRKDGKHEARRYDFERLKRMREGGLDIR
jgi:hypothetical protein